MRIGNTPPEVRDFLEQRIRQGYAPLGAPTPFEKIHFGTTCPLCGARTWLCYAPTGLPASSPHIERTLIAARDLEL